jgi:D-glycero-D-manno-heptose 1,7-bisphosphate phosphatase
LLLAIAEKYQINLNETYFIGDSWSDVQAAIAAGCRPILVLTGKGQEALSHHPELATFPYFPDLAGAVAYVLSASRCYDE